MSFNHSNYERKQIIFGMLWQTVELDSLVVSGAVTRVARVRVVVAFADKEEM